MAAFQPRNNQRAVLCDPDPSWLEAVGNVLDRTGVAVVGRATEPQDALALVKENKPDLFVTELEFDGQGMDAARYVQSARAMAPSMRVLILSGSTGPSDIEAAFRAGAVAYVVKTALPDDLSVAVRQLFQPSVLLAPSRNGHVEPSDDFMENHEKLRSLTPREGEILRLVAEGSANANVAKELWVSEQTVKFHLSNIYRKLGVGNRTEASRWAQLNGLLSAGTTRTDY